MISLLALVLALGSTVLAQTTTTAQPTVHVVQAGEKLYRISIRYGVSVASIAAAKNITNTNLIFVGQQLTIPGATGQPAFNWNGAVITDIPVSELNWVLRQWRNDGRCNNPDPRISRWHWQRLVQGDDRGLIPACRTGADAFIQR
jgi:LysM repeat protein